MSSWQIEPLPSPTAGVERREGWSASRAASRSSLDLVQDRFPNDRLHLDDTVCAYAIGRPGASISLKFLEKVSLTVGEAPQAPYVSRGWRMGREYFPPS